MNEPTHTIKIEIRGDFNAGWMHYVLGLKCPDDPVMAEGWEMASETTIACGPIRQIMVDKNTPYLVTTP